jgi:phosphatidylserine decarboxylase
MTIHKEGYKTLLLTILVLTLLNLAVYYALPEYAYVRDWVLILSIVFFLIILQFFRHPRRKIPYDESHVLAPADGKVVVIEETEETEYFKDRRMQVSIFMSPVNVHVNRYPLSGVVSYLKYHPGLFLVAWHPKSSTDNERTTVVINTGSFEVLMRQIAGALAKRIVFYPRQGDVVKQGQELGFIKFGSRVDLFLPLGSKINVKLNEKVKGGQTVLAEIPDPEGEDDDDII